jgi:hypothetical protein
MEIEWTAKEWTRVIYLMRKSIKKEANEADTKLLYKALIFAEQAKKDDEAFEDLIED